MTTAVETLGRDLTGQHPGNGGGKTKYLLDAGSL